MVYRNYVNHPRFGEIWMCNLRSQEGSVQSGYRPVFILSNNLNNTHSTTVNIIPLTSRMSKKKLPIHVELTSYEYYGLNAPSTMLVEQIQTVQTGSLDFRIGKIADEHTMRKIREAIRIQFPVFGDIAS